MIAKYMKDVKCESVNTLKIPQKGSKSKVAPLKKKPIRVRLITLKELTINRERNGG